MIHTLSKVGKSETRLESLALFTKNKDEICPEQWHALNQILNELSEVISSVHLEKRLHQDPRHGYDIILAIRKQQIATLENWIRSLPQDKQTQWNGVLRFIASRKTNKNLRTNSSILWLEFDYDMEFQAYSAPNICFCLTDKYLYGEPLTPENNLEAILDGVHAIIPEVEATILNSIRHCVNCLEKLGTIIHVSVMQARDPVAIKFFVELPRTEVIDFLIKAGWQGKIHPLWNMLDEMFPDKDYKKLHVDLNLHDFTSNPSSKLAFTYTQKHLSAASTLSPSRIDVLKQLQQKGLFQQGYCQLAENWPGRFCREKGETVTECTRWLDLKLVWQQDSLSEAKAYFAYSEYQLQGLQLFAYLQNAKSATVPQHRTNP